MPCSPSTSSSGSRSTPAASGSASRMFCSTVRQGRRRGSWKTAAMRVCLWGRVMTPSKSRSRPRRIRMVVVLPQPEGPIMQWKVPGSSWNWRSSRICVSTPSAERNALREICASSRGRPPPVESLFKRLHHEEFDREHDDDEGESISQDRGHVEELELEMDLETHPVRAAQKLDDKHDLPNQREARAARGQEIGLKLRQHHMA